MIITEEEAKTLGIEAMPPEMAGAEAPEHRAPAESQDAPDATMSKTAWNSGYRAGRRGEPGTPPKTVRDHYSWCRGFVEGRRKAGNYPVLLPVPRSWKKH